MSMNQLFIDVLPIISVTNDGRKTKLPSFDSSYRDGSEVSGGVVFNRYRGVLNFDREEGFCPVPAQRA